MAGGWFWLADTAGQPAVTLLGGNRLNEPSVIFYSRFYCLISTKNAKGIIKTCVWRGQTANVGIVDNVRCPW